jgi:hypothetical protein
MAQNVEIIAKLARNGSVLIMVVSAAVTTFGFGQNKNALSVIQVVRNVVAQRKQTALVVRVVIC